MGRWREAPGTGGQAGFLRRTEPAQPGRLRRQNERASGAAFYVISAHPRPAGARVVVGIIVRFLIPLPLTQPVGHCSGIQAGDRHNLTVTDRGDLLRLLWPLNACLSPLPVRPARRLCAARRLPPENLAGLLYGLLQPLAQSVVPVAQPPGIKNATLAPRRRRVRGHGIADDLGRFRRGRGLRRHIASQISTQMMNEAVTAPTAAAPIINEETCCCCCLWCFISC